MVTVGSDPLTLTQVAEVAYEGAKVEVHPHARRRIMEARHFVDSLVHTGEAVYGVNTGFGRLSDIRIDIHDLAKLQLNLVRSHAVGVGEPLSRAETRAMMLLRISVLSQGFSGARLATIDQLVEMLNRGVIPVIPSRGSVGASGDLAPLAHLALAVIGEGRVWHGENSRHSAEALAESGLEPIKLEAKEGLALLNGTQAIGAVGGLAVYRAARCVHVADAIGAMTLEALLGTPSAFDARIHEARRHKGQIASARHLRELVENSPLRESHRFGDKRVQDAYCLRCMPQVHGAVRATLQHAGDLLETETAAATDNPLIFANDQEVLSGGNFHAAPVSYALDYAAIAATDLLSISERRMDRLVNPDSSEGLMPFLADHPGLESGLMMAHVTIAALLSECKVLSHPASVDSVPTSGGKEDHVSMGMTSALKLKQIVKNLEIGLGIELFAACEGLERRRPLVSSAPVEKLHSAVRLIAKSLHGDRSLSEDFEAIANALALGKFDTNLEPVWPLISN